MDTVTARRPLYSQLNRPANRWHLELLNYQQQTAFCTKFVKFLFSPFFWHIRRDVFSSEQLHFKIDTGNYNKQKFDEIWCSFIFNKFFLSMWSWILVLVWHFSMQCWQSDEHDKLSLEQRFYMWLIKFNKYSTLFYLTFFFHKYNHESAYKCRIFEAKNHIHKRTHTQKQIRRIDVCKIRQKFHTNLHSIARWQNKQFPHLHHCVLL